MSLPRRKTKNSSERADQVAVLFLAAIEIPVEQRAEWLDHAVGGDAVLRGEIEGLIASHEKSGDFLSRPPVLSAVEATATALPVLSPGEAIDDFEIIETLGSGAFATVYLAWQPSLRRRVALKVSEDIGHEAQTMAQLQHDHIVRVYEERVLRERKLRLICMQYVPCVTLQDWLEASARSDRTKLHGSDLIDFVHRSQNEKAEPRPIDAGTTLLRLGYVESLLWIGAQMADALTQAHASGVLHLDVKPPNILISVNGRPLLTDFNVSLVESAIDTNPLGGTFDYMPPEQLTLFRTPKAQRKPGTLDGRADVYALGKVLEEGLKGALEEHPLAREITSVIRRATSPDRDDRFKDAVAFARALRGCLELSEIRMVLPREGLLTRLSLWRPLLVLTLGGAVIQLAASLVSISYNSAKIVTNLSPIQQLVFERMLNLYQPTLFLLGMVFWVSQLRPIHAYLTRKNEADGDALVKLRQRVLALPKRVSQLTLASWMPGSILFPLVLHLTAGGTEQMIFVHFFLSFSLSCAIALSYNALFADYLVLRALYPMFWKGTGEIRATALLETAPARRRIRLCQWLAAATPLFGAILMVTLGPERLEAWHYGQLRILVLLLLGLGLGGLWFTILTHDLFSETLGAFRGTRRSDSQ